MLIWLGKQYLGQSEKHELSGPAGGPISQEHTLNDSAKDKFISAIDRFAAQQGTAGDIHAAAFTFPMRINPRILLATPMGVGASNTYGMLVVMRNNIASSSLEAHCTNITHRAAKVGLNNNIIRFAAAIGDDFVATNGSKFILSKSYPWGEPTIMPVTEFDASAIQYQYQYQYQYHYFRPC